MASVQFVSLCVVKVLTQVWESVHLHKMLLCPRAARIKHQVRSSPHPSHHHVIPSQPAHLSPCPSSQFRVTTELGDRMYHNQAYWTFDLLYNSRCILNMNLLTNAQVYPHTQLFFSASLSAVGHTGEY